MLAAPLAANGRTAAGLPLHRVWSSGSWSQFRARCWREQRG